MLKNLLCSMMTVESFYSMGIFKYIISVFWGEYFMGKHSIKKDEFLSITSLHNQDCGIQLFVNLVSGK